MIFNVLFIFTVLSIVFHALHLNQTLIFFITCLGILPLAAYMGKATEELAKHRGPAIGGLLNATFGNATELIISFMALRAGLFDVVKASITGSIIGNLLLVLGLSLFMGGIKYKLEKFNRQAVSNAATLLTIATIGLVVPAAFSYVSHVPENAPVVETLSLWVSVILLGVYFLGLLFSLHTHRSLFAFAEEETPGEHAAEWSTRKAMVVLFATTLAVVVESEILVKSIESVVHTLGLTQLFVGVIIVAIIGNAAEHGIAVVMAMKRKTDLALNVATSSSTQIALFVAPVLVIAGYLIGKPMSLVFHPFEVMAVGISVLISSLVAIDGESNWFEGGALLAVYVILAIAFFYLR